MNIESERGNLNPGDRRSPDSKKPETAGGYA